ncbi:MAG: hypothetical protein U1E28_02100 [Beijerinckiaceae bacterium]
MARDEELRRLLERAIAHGSKLAGAFVGITAALKSGQPYLALSTPVIATALEEYGKGWIERQLGPRQEARVSRAVTVAVHKINERLSQGQLPRDDGFFDASEGHRSGVDEITEAALLAAMNSAQEKKVDHIAALMASISFNSDIGLEQGYQLVELAQSLSYRSFVLLKVFGEATTGSFPPRPDDSVAGLSRDTQSVMVDVFSLTRLSLMERVTHEGSDDLQVVLGWGEVEPCFVRLSALGRLLYDGLELKSLPLDDGVYVRTMSELNRVAEAGNDPPSRVNAAIDGGSY